MLKQIGEHLGRPVRLARIKSPREMPIDELAGSAVALLCCDDNRPEEFRPALSDIFAAAPVAIGFWGDHASAVLGVALEVQAASRGDLHVMTYLLGSPTSTEAMWEFLDVVFPSPERLDEWNGYSIVVSEIHAFLGERQTEAVTNEGEMTNRDLRFRDLRRSL